MIFRIDHTRGDTCGNEWIEGEPEYIEAVSLAKAWEKLKRPIIWVYWMGEKSVCQERTPKGKGFGIWETNPEFDWNRDMHKATGFSGDGGFVGIQVMPVKVRK